MKRGASATSQKSVQEVKKTLQKFLKTIDKVPREILEAEAERLYGEIIAEVPYETGKLERSVKVTVARDKRRPGLNARASARSKQGYNYAGIQHEETGFSHSKAGAKDHYISDPFERAVERIQEQLRDQLQPE